MSFLFCLVPDFPLAVAQRERPELASSPLAIVDGQGYVCALSDKAIASGVSRQMSKREARVYCPHLHILTLDDIQCEEAQSHLLAILKKWEIPAEAFGWGEACMDLRALTARRNEIRVLASELGQTIRQSLGPTFAPQLGWGVTPLAALSVARNTPAGYIRIDNQTEEQGITHRHSEAALAGFLAEHRHIDINQSQIKQAQSSATEQRFRTDFANLIAQYGPIFWQPRLVAADHPLAEARSRYIRL